MRVQKEIRGLHRDQVAATIVNKYAIQCATTETTRETVQKIVFRVTFEVNFEGVLFLPLPLRLAVLT